MKNHIKSFFCFILSVVIILSISETYCFCATPTIPKTFSIGLGGTLKIPADISNCSGTTKKWSSAGDTIEVGNSGTVKGLKLGTGTAYCSTEKGEVAICKVTVVPAADVSISNNQIELNQNESYKLNFSVSPANAIQTVDWITNNESVATITSDGTVTARSNGTATISCISQDGTNNKAECTIKVLPKQTTTISTTKQKNKAKTKRTTKEAITQKNITKIKTTKKKNINSNKNTTKTPSSKETTVSTTKDTIETTTKVIMTTEKYINGNSEKEESQDIDYYNNNDYISVNNGYNLNAISKKKKPIIVSWNELNDADGYELYSAKASNDYYLIYDGKNCSYNKNTYTNGDKYFFYVKAYKFNDNEKIYFDNSEFIEITAVKKSLFQQIFG